MGNKYIIEMYYHQMIAKLGNHQPKRGRIKDAESFLHAPSSIDKTLDLMNYSELTLIDLEYALPGNLQKEKRIESLIAETT